MSAARGLLPSRSRSSDRVLSKARRVECRDGRGSARVPRAWPLERPSARARARPCTRDACAPTARSSSSPGAQVECHGDTDGRAVTRGYPRSGSMRGLLPSGSRSSDRLGSGCPRSGRSPSHQPVRWRTTSVARWLAPQTLAAPALGPWVPAAERRHTLAHGESPEFCQHFRRGIWQHPRARSPSRVAAKYRSPRREPWDPVATGPSRGAATYLTRHGIDYSERYPWD